MRRQVEEPIGATPAPGAPAQAEGVRPDGTRGAAIAERRDVVWQDGVVAAGYLAGTRGAIPGAALQIDAVLRVVAAANRPVRRLLDLGCGDGVLTAALLARYPKAAATLVDFSPAMLAAAADRFADRPPTRAPRLVAADLADPAWRAAVAAGAPFDLVVSGFAIHHLTDARKRALYAEIFGLLAPGGVFANLEHVSSPSPWLEQIFDDLMVDALTAHHATSDLPRPRAEVAAEYAARPDRSANLLAPVDTQCARLREVGFRDVDCWFKLFELAVFGGRRPGDDHATGKG